MPDTKPIEKASQVSAADLAALRDDITKLTALISELMPEQASSSTSTVYPFLSVACRIFCRITHWGDEPYKESNSWTRNVLDAEAGVL